MEIYDFYDPNTDEDYDFVAPTTVEDIFQDYRGRRSGLLLALTTNANRLCFLCSAEGINNMGLYGFPNGKWDVRYPPKELDLPQPKLGIKYVGNGIQDRQNWLVLIAKQSDSWLLSVFNYFASQLSPSERTLLFNLINKLPTLYRVVTGDEIDDPEMSIVVYKVRECRMQEELIKLWKKHKASNSASNVGPTLEVWIPSEHVSSTNPQVKGRQLWGTDKYSDDSDLVAVLMHIGYFRHTASPLPPSVQEELRTIIRVLPPQDTYTSKLRNNVQSRHFGPASDCSYRVERCYMLKEDGGTIELKPSLTMEPTVAVAPMAASSQQRFAKEVTIQYNLCNEPWMKYSISVVADKGLQKHLFTSARLKKGEVLYLETHSRRYELCFAGEKTMKAFQASQQQSSSSSHDAMETDKSQNHLPHLTNGDKKDSDNTIIDVFRWSRCKNPLPQKVMESLGVPLPPEYVEVLEENLDWEDIQWSGTGVWIAGKEYKFARVQFLSPK